MKYIELQKVDKIYNGSKVAFHALKSVNVSIERGDLVAIVGPSGSGKSTILNMLTGIDRPTKGNVVIDGVTINTMKEDGLAAWRGANIGIVFQFFQLFPTLTALENAMLPMDFARRGSLKERKTLATRNLELVGLGGMLHKLPSQLSGGEQQRVAIARALANDPPIIIGDEPTGNLDSTTEARMFDIFKTLNERGKTIIYVTHSRDLAARASRRIIIRDGRIVEQ